MSPTQIPHSPSLLRRACLSLTLLVALQGTLAVLCRASVVIPSPLTPAEDGWVDGSAPNNSNAASGFLKASGNNSATSKQIYLKFTIEKSYIDDNSTPLAATLTLTRDSGATGGTLTVYAAKNWPSGTPPKFGDVSALVPASLPALKSQPNSSSTTQAFDVTDYISGPGEYTFWMRSTSTADVVFKSDNSTSGKPTLTLTKATYNPPLPDPDHTEYDRLISDVMRRSDAYKARYIAFNSTGINDVNLVGYFDVTKSPYNAKGDWTSANNGADDTVAIQRAINEARDARMAVYFPAGKKFRVTAPLECVQGFMEYENQFQLNPPASADYYQSTGYERWNHREFPCVLMGPALPLDALNRPTLIAGIGAFGSATNPAPLLHFWARGTGEGTGNPPTENYPAAAYNHLVRNLDIDLRGRPGAIGINMVGAQGTAIESLKITATNSYAGISGLPGAGGCTSAVTIDGGRYGIDAYKTTLDGGTGIASVLNNCTINGTTNTLFIQTNSIRWNHYGPIVLVGCDIKGGPVAIAGSGDESIPTGTEDGPTSRGNLSIADSKIEMITLGSAITGSRSVYLRNVYLKNVTAVAAIATTAGDGGANPTVPTSDWFLVKEYSEGAILDQYDGRPISLPDTRVDYPSDGTVSEPTPIYVNGQHQIGVAVRSSFASGAPAGNFLDKHKWPPAIDWTGSDVVNVRNLQSTISGYVGASIPSYAGDNAQGDNTIDDLEIIQDAVAYAKNNNKKVFIPAGQYLLNDTLVLEGSVVLFGLHKNYSVLKANDHPHTVDGGGNWVSSGSTIFDNGGPASGTPLVMTPADTGNNQTTKLADLMLLQRMTADKTYLLDWNAGAKSVVQNVNFNRQTVNAGKFGGTVSNMNVPLIKVGALGGGRWYSMFHLSGGNAGPNYRGIEITGTSTRALKFYMFNPEIDAGPTYNVEISDRTNLDVFGSKSEGRHMPFVHLTNCKDVRWLGFAGNGYCDAFITPENNTNKGNSEAVIELQDCDGVVLSSCSFHPNFLENGGDYATDPLTFYRLKEKVGTNYNTTPGHKGFVFFRRDPNDLIVDID